MTPSRRPHHNPLKNSNVFLCLGSFPQRTGSSGFSGESGSDLEEEAVIVAGAGLGSVFDSAEDFSPASVLTPEVIAALAGLAILALIPVAHKKLKTRRLRP